MPNPEPPRIVGDATEDGRRAITIAETAAVLGVDRSTVLKFIEDGRLPAISLGSTKRRISVPVLNRFLNGESNSVAAAQPEVPILYDDRFGVPMENGWAQPVPRRVDPDHVAMYKQMHKSAAELARDARESDAEWAREQAYKRSPEYAAKVAAKQRRDDEWAAMTRTERDAFLRARLEANDFDGDDEWTPGEVRRDRKDIEAHFAQQALIAEAAKVRRATPVHPEERWGEASSKYWNFYFTQDENFYAYYFCNGVLRDEPMGDDVVKHMPYYLRDHPPVRAEKLARANVILVREAEEAYALTADYADAYGDEPVVTFDDYTGLPDGIPVPAIVNPDGTWTAMTEHAHVTLAEPTGPTEVVKAVAPISEHRMFSAYAKAIEEIVANAKEPLSGRAILNAVHERGLSGIRATGEQAVLRELSEIRDVLIATDSGRAKRYTLSKTMASVYNDDDTEGEK